MVICSVQFCTWQLAGFREEAPSLHSLLLGSTGFADGEFR